MVAEIVQNYVDLVNSLTRATRERAAGTARGLLAQAGLEGAADDAGERLGKLAEEIAQANRANRDLVEKLVAAEVDKTAARWGFARAEDLTELREEIAELRRSQVRATVGTPTTPGSRRGPGARGPGHLTHSQRAARVSVGPGHRTAEVPAADPVDEGGPSLGTDAPVGQDEP